MSITTDNIIIVQSSLVNFIRKMHVTGLTYSMNEVILSKYERKLCRQLINTIDT